MTPELLLGLYRQVCRIRYFEVAVERLIHEGKVRGLVHVSIGHEAVAAGVCAAMAPQDYLLTGHRGHGHVLARGADLYRTVAEILGRAAGLCGGRGGSMHLVATEKGIIGATGIVGGNLPLALGAAYTSLVLRTGGAAVAFFGDGAVGNGAFHESLNLAALWRLPVLFVCENNEVAEFTRREEHTRVARLVDLARVYGMSAERVAEGADAVAVYEAARLALELVRGGGGPYFLEVTVRRLRGHYVGDVRATRRGALEEREIEKWDPVLRTRRRLEDEGMRKDELDVVMAEAEREVEEAVERALASKEASAVNVEAEVYA